MNNKLLNLAELCPCAAHYDTKTHLVHILLQTHLYKSHWSKQNWWWRQCATFYLFTFFCFCIRTFPPNLVGGFGVILEDTRSYTAHLTNLPLVCIFSSSQRLWILYYSLSVASTLCPSPKKLLDLHSQTLIHFIRTHMERVNNFRYFNKIVWLLSCKEFKVKSAPHYHIFIIIINFSTTNPAGSNTVNCFQYQCEPHYLHHIPASVKRLRHHICRSAEHWRSTRLPLNSSWFDQWKHPVSVNGWEGEEHSSVIKLRFHALYPAFSAFINAMRLNRSLSAGFGIQVKWKLWALVSSRLWFGYNLVSVPPPPACFLIPSDKPTLLPFSPNQTIIHPLNESLLLSSLIRLQDVSQDFLTVNG